MANQLWEKASQTAFLNEQEAVSALLKRTQEFARLREPIAQRAQLLVETMRREAGPAAIESFLGEYGLDSREGVALLCIAEALLRIPDRFTASKLIRGLMQSGEWSRHLGQSESPFVNASSWGLLLTGKVVDAGDWGENQLTQALGIAIRRLGEPVAREAMKAALRLAGRQFVLGRDIDEALANARPQGKEGYLHSFDMLGEGARTSVQADSYFEKYLQCIKAVGASADHSVPLIRRSGVSVKLSALHPRFELRQEKRIMSELLPRVATLVNTAMQSGIPLSIDAEESTRFDLYVALFEALLRDQTLGAYEGLGFVLQAYQKRAIHAVEALKSLARDTKRRIPVRLVKGAYWDSEIKWAQEQGLADYAVFTRKEHTDLSYLACAHELLANPECFYPQFATHNALTVASILEIAGDTEFEFQRLHGMGEALHDQVLSQVPSRIYAPVGTHEALLPYLIRRLLENGANTSFVHLMVDTKTPISEMLVDPVQRVESTQGARSEKIPLPEYIYPDRRNSKGCDLGNRVASRELFDALARFQTHRWQEKGRVVHNPAQLAEVVGHIEPVDVPQLDAMVARAVAAFDEYEQTPAPVRAEMLRHAADLLEENHAELIALIIREGGRTINDAIAEVREAADFCRYYAARAEELFADRILAGPTGEKNIYRLCGRGVFVCISPWNFPLGIFTGQVVAALAAGNTVLAKPADQTPLVARRAVELLHEAGFAPGVVQLVCGPGRTVGNALVHDARIAGVAFTGSTATAKMIAQTLAARDGALIPFIAETGGINVMAVDSSALIEQTVDDIVRSAFGSAGQRCSALRVLLLQEEIADELLSVLQGAMQQLTIGNPWDFSTDVGPLIDAGARNGVAQQAEKLPGRVIARASLPAGLNGHFLAPVAVEIKSLAGVKEEIFGPVLQVMRYQAEALPEMLQQVNALGYGLTFGMQSRVQEHVELAGSMVRAGNIYINRSMIGATVGVQPFGGEGLSGTGPKAGGPYTLLRFASERAISNNVAAIGGNIELLR